MKQDVAGIFGQTPRCPCFLLERDRRPVICRNRVTRGDVPGGYAPNLYFPGNPLTLTHLPRETSGLNL